MTTAHRVMQAAGSVLIASLAFGAPVLAQQQNGITSGPAVGTPVVPSTTAQKQNPRRSGEFREIRYWPSTRRSRCRRSWSCSQVRFRRGFVARPGQRQTPVT